MLVDADRNFAVLGAQPFAYSATLDKIEGYFGPSEVDDMIDGYEEAVVAIERMLKHLRSGGLRSLTRPPEQEITKAEKTIAELESILRSLKAMPPFKRG